MGARVNLTKLISMRDTKSNVEANTATMEEISFAYATDTAQIGIYTNGAWVWIGGTTATGQYRQFVWSNDGSGGWEFTSANGEPVLHLQDLE